MAGLEPAVRSDGCTSRVWPGCSRRLLIPTLMGHEWWHKLPARLYLTLVSHQLYVKSSVVNGCIATPTNLKLLQRALPYHIGAQGDERDAELAVAKVQCANESSTNSTDGLVALTAATMPRCAAASLHFASSRPVSARPRSGAAPELSLIHI